MITLIEKIGFPLSEENISVIESCAKIIKNGGLVAFPTETVYGLGANALISDAVKGIYAAKGRPSDNPLIVHINDIDTLNLIAKNISNKAMLLIDKFWPGPLTIIFDKTDVIPKETAGGLDTVAVRMPKNEIAKLLIDKSGVPIAAPSANLSGKPSPTKASHVIDDLNGKVNAIIDGGSSDIGLESTVIDMSTDIPCILRPGAITKSMIESVIGNVILDKNLLNEHEKPKSPGMKYKHYAPDADIILVQGNNINNVVNKIIELSNSYTNKNIGIICTEETKDFYKNYNNVISLGSKNNTETIAKNLFDTFREFNKLNVDIIFAEGLPEENLELAIMNRLKKASGYNIINV